LSTSISATSSNVDLNVFIEVFHLSGTGSFVAATAPSAHM